MKNYTVCKIDLRLFDGGEGTGAAAPAEADTVSKGDTQADPVPTRRGKKGEVEKVLYGKQDLHNNSAGSDAEDGQFPSSTAADDSNSDVSVTSDSLENKRKAFQELVNGEYKDIYTKEIQRIINRRFNETRNLEAQVQKNQPVIDMLMQRYNIDDGDMDRLKTAIENDDVYWSEAAEEAGMSVEQYKKFQKLQRENAALLKEQRKKQGEQQAQQQLQKWYMEAEQVKMKFPSFDLGQESQNPQFISMLRAGIPVEHAYKVLHMDDIMTDAMRTTAVNTEKRVVDNVRAKGHRPAENGTAAQSAFTVKDDVSKLTRKDRAEIARRVARGENIEF